MKYGKRLPHKEDYYASIESEVVKMARQKSNSIVQSLYQKVLWEWVASIVILIGAIYYVRNMSSFYWFVGLCVLTLGITWIPYRDMLRKIKATPTQNMVECLTSYINVLNGFIQRLKWLAYILAPIGFLFGLFAGMNNPNLGESEDLSLTAAVMIILISVASLGGMFWFIYKWYIPKLYGKPKEELEVLLEGLKQEV